MPRYDRLNTAQTSHFPGRFYKVFEFAEVGEIEIKNDLPEVTRWIQSPGKPEWCLDLSSAHRPTCRLSVLI